MKVVTIFCDWELGWVCFAVLGNNVEVAGTPAGVAENVLKPKYWEAATVVAVISTAAAAAWNVDYGKPVKVPVSNTIENPALLRMPEGVKPLNLIL
jgi:hypothetical protein